MQQNTRCHNILKTENATTVDNVIKEQKDTVVGWGKAEDGEVSLHCWRDRICSALLYLLLGFPLSFELVWSPPSPQWQLLQLLEKHVHKGTHPRSKVSVIKHKHS